MKSILYSFWSDFLYVKIDLLDYAILGAVTATLSILSDLLESFMKRCANVKVIFKN
jgi:CDP-diglyceride synthetase